MRVPFVVVIVIVIALSACRLDFADRGDAGTVADAPPGFANIGGTVAGLTGGAVELQDNAGDSRIVSANGAFTFSTPVMFGQPYDVTVSQPPSGENCTVANGSGVAEAPVDDIVVTCFGAGACPPAAVTYTDDGSFVVPTGCTSFLVDAQGGGGGGSAKNDGTTGAAGGAGGQAMKTFTGIADGTTFTITIGRGGACGSKVQTTGGYTGGGGGDVGHVGGDGAGTGGGGAGGGGSLHGAAGGSGGYGGGGGGGGGDDSTGDGGGGATTFRLAAMDWVVAGGGGGAGVSDEDVDVAGAGGAACDGTTGDAGMAAIAGQNSSGGGGGGGCSCLGGCDAAPTPSGGAGGLAGTTGACGAGQVGESGKVTLTFP